MGRHISPIFTVLAATTHEKFGVQNAIRHQNVNNEWIKLEYSQTEIP